MQASGGAWHQSHKPVSQGTVGVLPCLQIQVGDKWIPSLSLILCGNYRKMSVATELERNAFPGDEFSQLYLMENMSCRSLNAAFPGGFYLAERKTGLLTERSQMGKQSEGRGGKYCQRES